MKRTYLNFTAIFKILAISLFLLVTFTQTSSAAINGTINFQGKVVDKTTGTNVTDGDYDFIFRLYDAASGGTLLWTENHTSANDVTVTDGIFRVSLGSITSLSSVDFDSANLYLDITFNSEAFGSRVRFSAVPYAFNAEQVNGLSVTNNGGNTLNIAANKTFIVSNSLTLSGADSKAINFGSNNLTFSTSGDTTLTLPTSGTVTALGNTTTGSGSTLVLASNPSFAGITLSSGAITLAGSTGSGLCITGGSTATWGSCGSGGGTNYWNLVSGNGVSDGGYITPINSTADFLLGEQSTISAKFAFTGLSSLTNQTQASFSGQLIVMPNNGYSGKVGIGTINPSDELQVAGTARVYDLAAHNLLLSDSTTSILTAVRGFDGYTNFSGGIGTTGTQRITSTGNLVNIGSIQAGETLLTRGGTFATKVDYTGSDGARSVEVVDLNADGWKDLAVANYYTDNMSVFLNNGDGTFATKVDYSSGTGANPWELAVGDVNGDSMPDIITTNDDLDNFSLFLNNGDGTFATKVDYTTGDAPVGVVITDVNGDGKADVMITNRGVDNDVSVFINNGNGTFAPRVDYAAGTTPRNIAAGDLDGDGWTDLAVPNYGSDTLSVYINNGNGTFATKVDYATAANPINVVIADVDGDGQADIATSNYVGDNISVFINDGDGTFATKVDYTASNQTHGIAAGDVNGDGWMDLVVSNEGPSTAGVFINDKDGTFASQASYSTAADPSAIGVGDLDGDGKADLVTSNFTGDNISVFINQDSPMFFAQASTGYLGIGDSSPVALLSVGSGDLFQVDTSGNTTLQNQADLRFGDADGSNYVAFQAPTTVSSNVTWTLPSADSSGCLQSNGSGIISIASCGGGGGTDGMTITTFPSDGTWTKSNYTGLKFTQVIVTGSGGGGGGADGGDTSSEVAAGGGGAGGTTIEMFAAAALGTTEAVDIGTPGSGGAATNGGNGTAGGASSFGVTDTTANGGNLGEGVNNATLEMGVGGSGGAATTDGDVEIPGGAGGGGAASLEGANGGVGGASYWGGGGLGGSSSLQNACTAGSNGSAFGAGGGGAACEDQTTGAAGGNGTAGVVVTFNYTASSGDLAEWYETKDGVEAGDVVAISKENLEYDSRLGLQKISILEKASTNSEVVGVVSTSPFETIGGDILNNAKRPRPIALAGRVPVKITEANGKIKTGDLLAASNIPGIAKKATKAGITIGRAMEDSNCKEGQDCKVMVLVNTSYSTGALIKTALNEGGINTDQITSELDYGKILFAQMLQDKKDIVDSEISEINTDRIAAGLEVITPRVITEEILANFIKPVDQDIALQLSSDGSFIVKDETGLEAIKFDSSGNATFAGVVTADKIRANQIEGIEFIIASQSATADRIASITSELDKRLASSSAGAITQELSELSLFQRIRIKENAIVEGILTVVDSITVSNLIANNLSTFFGEVIFKGSVFFEERPTFNKDTAGIAVIKKDSNRVEIKFDKEYKEIPVINATLMLNEYKNDVDSVEDTRELEEKLFLQDYSYAVINKSNKGFTIVLNKKAVEDVEFSWFAVSIKQSPLSLGEKIKEFIITPNLSSNIPATSSPEVEEGGGS